VCSLDGTMSESTIITPRLLKTRDAARYLGVSAWKLRNIVQAGELACIVGDGTSPWLLICGTWMTGLSAGNRPYRLGPSLGRSEPNSNLLLDECTGSRKEEAPARNGVGLLEERQQHLVVSNLH